jgi:hypothetical protein
MLSRSLSRLASLAHELLLPRPQGTAAANELTLNVLAPVLEYAGVASLAKLGNPKATLAQLLEEESATKASYRTVRSSGAGKHTESVYLVEVYSGSKMLGEGAGFTVEMAEADAAKSALLKEFTAEVEEVVLPSTWGNYAVADAEAMIGQLFPTRK